MVSRPLLDLATSVYNNTVPRPLLGLAMSVYLSNEVSDMVRAIPRYDNKLSLALLKEVSDMVKTILQALLNLAVSAYLYLGPLLDTICTTS